MAVIRIHDLAVEAIVGIYPHEREKRQPLIIGLELTTDIRAAAASDLFTDALDYEALANGVRELTAASEFQLIESLAVAILADIMVDKRITAATVRLRKPNAIAAAKSVEIEVTDSRD